MEEEVGSRNGEIAHSMVIAAFSFLGLVPRVVNLTGGA
jgi:hypothetical protein